MGRRLPAGSGTPPATARPTASRSWRSHRLAAAAARLRLASPAVSLCNGGKTSRRFPHTSHITACLQHGGGGANNVVCVCLCWFVVGVFLGGSAGDGRRWRASGPGSASARWTCQPFSCRWVNDSRARLPWHSTSFPRKPDEVQRAFRDLTLRGRCRRRRWWRACSARWLGRSGFGCQYR